jgi:hypothetical protein
MNKEISEEEYYAWLQTARVITPEHCTFSSAGSGPHSFTTDLEKDGILYELTWGWGWNMGGYDDHYYGIKCLYKLEGQGGEGI